MDKVLSTTLTATISFVAWQIVAQACPADASEAISNAYLLAFVPTAFIVSLLTNKLAKYF